MPPGDLGSFITDAFGKFHDISKSAFDAYSISHEGNFDPGFNKLMKEGFTKAAKDVLTRAGVSNDMLDTFGTTSWQDTVVSVIESEMAGLVTLVGAVGAEMGPLGVAMALAVSAGAPILQSYWSNIKNSFLTTTPQDGYKNGQWISIDNGMTTAVRGLHNVLDESFLDVDRRRRLHFESNVLHDLGPIQPVLEGLEIEVDNKENFSTGFYLGQGQSASTIVVYNFLTSREETQNIEKVRPLETAAASSLDNDPVWSEIRLLKFETRRERLLPSNINTDPGSEVLYNGLKNLVLQARGKEVLIENKLTGARHMVQLDMLQAGKRTHDNSWNYENLAPEGYSSAPQPGFSSGSFVWVPPDTFTKLNNPFCTRQLACVELLEGASWQGFTAIDGTFCTFRLDNPKVRRVSDELNEMFGASHIFNNFRDAVIRGHDVARMACGKHEAAVLVSLGVSPLKTSLAETEQSASPPKAAPKAAASGGAATLLGYSGDGGLRDDIDIANEVGITGTISRDYDPQQDPSSGGGGGGLALAVGIGGAAAFLLR